MIGFHKIVATFFGIGYLGKGSGTVAAIIYCIIWFLIPAGLVTNGWQVLITVIIILAGTWSSSIVDATWGKDSNKVVIDEIAGMSISLLFVPHNIYFLAAALVLFRFFDIVKPLFIRRMESLPKGYGVMADDVLAGIYSLAIIQAVIATGSFKIE